MKTRKQLLRERELNKKKEDLLINGKSAKDVSGDLYLEVYDIMSGYSQTSPFANKESLVEWLDTNESLDNYRDNKEFYGEIIDNTETFINKACGVVLDESKVNTQEQPKTVLKESLSTPKKEKRARKQNARLMESFDVASDVEIVDKEDDDYDEQKREEFVEDIIQTCGIKEDVAKQIANNLDTRKIYVCTEDNQGGDFGVGKKQSELDWASTALGWGDTDGLFDEVGDTEDERNKWFLDVFKTDSIIPYIQDMWELTIVPEDEVKDPDDIDEYTSEEALKEAEVEKDYKVIVSAEDYQSDWEKYQELEEKTLEENGIDIDYVLGKITSYKQDDEKYEVDNVVDLIPYVDSKNGPDFVKFNNGNYGFVGEFGDRLEFITSDSKKIKELSNKLGIGESLEESVNYNELLKDAYKILDDANIRFDVDGTTFEFVDDNDAENAWKLLANKYGKDKVSKKGLFKVTLNLDENLNESKEDNLDKTLKDEYNSRLDKYASKFGYKTGKELEKAMKDNFELEQKVFKYDDGDNFLFLYQYYPDTNKDWENEDTYYNEPLEDVLKSIVNGKSSENLQEAKDKQYTITWSGHHSDRVNEKTGTLEELKKYFSGRLSHTNKPVKSIKGLLNALADAEHNSYNGYDPYYYDLKESLQEANGKLDMFLPKLVDLLNNDKELISRYGKELAAGKHRPYKNFATRLIWDIYWYLHNHKGFDLEGEVDKLKYDKGDAGFYFDDSHIDTLLRKGFKQAGISTDELDYKSELEESLKYTVSIPLYSLNPDDFKSQDEYDKTYDNNVSKTIDTIKDLGFNYALKGYSWKTSSGKYLDDVTINDMFSSVAMNKIAPDFVKFENGHIGFHGDEGTYELLAEINDPINESKLDESSVSLKQEKIGKFYVESRWDKGNTYVAGVYEKGPNDVYKTVVKKEYTTKEDAEKAFDKYLKLVKQGKYGSINESLDIDGIRKNLDKYSLDELKDIFTDIINETEGLDEDDPRATDLSDLYNEIDSAIHDKESTNESLDSQNKVKEFFSKYKEVAVESYDDAKDSDEVDLAIVRFNLDAKDLDADKAFKVHGDNSIEVDEDYLKEYVYKTYKLDKLKVDKKEIDTLDVNTQITPYTHSIKQTDEHPGEDWNTFDGEVSIKLEIPVDSEKVLKEALVESKNEITVRELMNHLYGILNKLDKVDANTTFPIYTSTYGIGEFIPVKGGFVATKDIDVSSNDKEINYALYADGNNFIGTYDSLEAAKSDGADYDEVKVIKDTYVDDNLIDSSEVYTRNGNDEWSLDESINNKDKELLSLLNKYDDLSSNQTDENIEAANKLLIEIEEKLPFKNDEVKEMWQDFTSWGDYGRWYDATKEIIETGDSTTLRDIFRKVVK